MKHGIRIEKRVSFLKAQQTRAVPTKYAPKCKNIPDSVNLNDSPPFACGMIDKIAITTIQTTNIIVLTVFIYPILANFSLLITNYKFLYSISYLLSRISPNSTTQPIDHLTNNHHLSYSPISYFLFTICHLLFSNPCNLRNLWT